MIKHLADCIHCQRGQQPSDHMAMNAEREARMASATRAATDSMHDRYHRANGEFAPCDRCTREELDAERRGDRDN
jgi:hypothetical protein